jgi:DNA repair exonuclease SbcCD ATPase subunit
LDVDDVKSNITNHKKKIIEINARKAVLQKSIDSLIDVYDEKRLIELIEKRDEHKQIIYNKKFEIKEEERKISDWQHEIEIINGKIFNLKRDGKKLLDEITLLKNSKICTQCGQTINKKEHQDHIISSVKEKETEMFNIAKEIKDYEANIISNQNITILNSKTRIIEINKEIVSTDLEMEDVLKEIGILNNQKNDVERRKDLKTELNQIPLLIQNEDLKISILEQKIINYENSLKQIVENNKIEKGIDASKLKIKSLETEESDVKEDIYVKKSSIGERQLKVKNNELLITEFKVQEYQDSVMNLYKKCVHRDGIPRQMLSNYIIPKINLTLERILSVALFKVWLDPDDLRPKLIYHSRPNSIIDCIGASGKERTFSSVVLKFALNQINVKAKPSIFLLDEVMGKLDANSVEEFREILQLIKSNMKKVLVIEQKEEINPDYLINVILSEDGISSLVIE